MLSKQFPAASLIPICFAAHGFLFTDDTPFVEIIEPIFAIDIIQMVDIVRRIVCREALKIAAQIFFNRNVFQRNTFAGVKSDTIFDCLPH